MFLLVCLENQKRTSTPVCDQFEFHFLCHGGSQPAPGGRVSEHPLPLPPTPFCLLAAPFQVLQLTGKGPAGPVREPGCWLLEQLVRKFARVAAPRGFSVSCGWPLMLGQLEQTHPLSITHPSPSPTQQVSEKTIIQDAFVLAGGPGQSWAGGRADVWARAREPAFLAGSNCCWHTGPSDPWNSFYFPSFPLGNFLGT